MKVKKEVARDISYASSAKSKAGRAVIRSIENMTGRIRLIKKAKNYENEVALGRNFWEVILEKYKINLNIIEGSFDNIPKKGPVVVVANHPYGILDGLLLGHILSSTRKDFRILAHRIFKKAKDSNTKSLCLISVCFVVGFVVICLDNVKIKKDIYRKQEV
jgi:putative hemolysin